MMIQIGLRCKPDWLCNGIGWSLALLLGLMLLGLGLKIAKEVKNRRQNKYAIRFRRDNRK